MKKCLLLAALRLLFSLFLIACCPLAALALDAQTDRSFLEDRARLDALQREAFLFLWETADSVSGMIDEGTDTRYWAERPLATGGTGFGIAAIVTAADRGWISREQAVNRLLKITVFLRDKSPRRTLHGALPHWLNGRDGSALGFAQYDDGADILETALLMQGLLIARSYFNGPGPEQKLRGIITGLWEEVDWNWFTNGEENGLYWHWSPKTGFSAGLKILGYNESLILYVLALSSPTHPISPAAYAYWTSGKGYQPKDIYGYRVEASLSGGGPLFLTQFAFIGLDPRRMADEFVPNGYFVRNVRQTLSNRGYCLYLAPEVNKYGPSVWGLTASYIKSGYAANEPNKDSSTVAPTAALSSMPYTPYYSLQVLEKLDGELREQTWGPYGPYDAFSLRFQWFSRNYLAINQLPIVSMVENYRSGLLWNLLMADKDVRRGLELAGIREPRFEAGFPEAVPALEKKDGEFVPGAYEICRHPDSGLYHVPYWTEEAGITRFSLRDVDGRELEWWDRQSAKGRNLLQFGPLALPDENFPGYTLTLIMLTAGREFSLPLRLH